MFCFTSPTPVAEGLSVASKSSGTLLHIAEPISPILGRLRPDFPHKIVVCAAVAPNTRRRGRSGSKGRIPADFGRRAGEKEFVHRVEDDVRIVD